jgi:DNA-binding IclR family transcriptional regulator
MNVGARLPAYATPMGWLLLSDLAPREIAHLFDGVAFSHMSEHTPGSIEELLQRVASAAANGVVISRGLVEHGGSSVTAPVFDKTGHVAAAIDISGPDSAFDLDTLDTRYSDAVRQTAQQISRRLGHSPNTRR